MSKPKSWLVTIGIVAFALSVAAMLGGIIYGGYKLNRWWNWKFGYESKVEEVIRPLQDRIKKLEEKLK